MALIEWSEALSIGFDEIDQDHMKLVEIVNNLNDAVTGELAPENVARIFAELLSYTQWHFRHEERLMQTYGYQAFFDHKGEHDELMGRAAELNSRYQGGDESVPGALLPFLKEWLANHIQQTDKKLGAYLTEKMG